MVLLVCCYLVAVMALKIFLNVEQILIRFHPTLPRTFISLQPTVPSKVSQTEREEYEYWDSKTTNYDYEITDNNYCIILLWTSVQEMPKDDWPPEGTKLKGNCIITYYHRYLQDAGIVVIHQSQAGGVLPWLFHR